MPDKTKQVKNMLLEQIISGEFKEGAPIPSRVQLMRRCDCSRTTIERAIRSLTEYGYLSGRRGSGTYVCCQNPEYEIRELRIVTGNDQLFSDSVFSELILNKEVVGIPVVWFDVHRIRENIDRLTSPGGAVVWAFPDLTDLWELKFIRHHNIPLILLNRHYEGFNAIKTDVATSIREGLTWLMIEAGRELAFVAARPTWTRPFQQERVISAFEAALQLDARFKPDHTILYECYDIPLAIAEIERKLFTGDKPPKGIFVLTREFALPLVICGQSHNLKPGQDYKLLTFDYIPELAGTPGIAMLRQRYHLFKDEIVRWLQSGARQSGDHKDRFFSELKAELIVN